MIQEIEIGRISEWFGHEFVSDWVTLDQDRISAFADVTDDHNWVHVDVERAKALRGTTIAHGFLVLTLLPGLVYKMMKVTGVAHALNYGVDNVRFTGIVNTGSRVRLRMKITGQKPRGDGVVISYDFVFERENEEKPACVGELLAIAFPEAGETRPSA